MLSLSESLESVYAELPEVKCKGKCSEACGPVLMSSAEEQVFRSAGKAVPRPTAMLLSGDASCPHLTPLNRCSVYEIRPLICRLYGVVKAIRCEFGCVPERWLSDVKAHELLKRAEKL